MTAELGLDDVAAQSPRALAELRRLSEAAEDAAADRAARDLYAEALSYYAAMRGPVGEPARRALATTGLPSQ